MRNIVGIICFCFCYVIVVVVFRPEITLFRKLPSSNILIEQQLARRVTWEQCDFWSKLFAFFIKGFLIFPCFVAAFWSSQGGELAKIRVCKIFWYLQSLTWNETVKFNWWRRFPKISKTKAGKSVQETDIGHKHKHKSDSFWVDFCYSDCSDMNYFQTSS